MTSTARTAKTTPHGNGHAASAARATKPAPALATAGGRKEGGILLADDFKDF